jgi:hypothetical protein
VTPPRWSVPVLACALTGVLSSGVTAVVMRAREPHGMLVAGELLTTPEQRDLVTLLVAPGPSFRAESPGSPVDAHTTTGLASLGFRRGWVRTWRSGGDRVDSFVLEFEQPTGAEGYAGGIGRAATMLIKPVPFTVAGVPGASGLADTMKDRSGHYAQVVVLHRGARAVLLVFTNDSPTPPPTVADLARREWDALGA